MRARRAFSPLRLALLGLILVFVAAVVLLRTSSSDFLLVPDRAHPLANLVTVPGSKAKQNGGGIYYVDVLERRASLLERLFPGIRSGSTLVQQNQLAPPGVSNSQRIQADQLDMQLSQQIASAVALRALGYKAGITEHGVRVAVVYSGTHAVGVLRSGDVIVSADGKPTQTIEQLHDVISSKKVGAVVPIEFIRSGVRHRVDITTSRDPLGGNRAIIGIEPEPAIRVNAPFKIKFDLGDVGGPSAGLAFALQILEEEGRDVDHGYKVAATGVINPDGTVGEIGGIKQKTIGAREAHVDVFLVPAGDNYNDAKKYAHGLRIIPVKSFQQALRALATLPPKT